MTEQKDQEKKKRAKKAVQVPSPPPPDIDLTIEYPHVIPTKVQDESSQTTSTYFLESSDNLIFPANLSQYFKELNSSSPTIISVLHQIICDYIAYPTMGPSSTYRPLQPLPVATSFVYINRVQDPWPQLASMQTSQISRNLGHFFTSTQATPQFSPVIHEVSISAPTQSLV